MGLALMLSDRGVGVPDDVCSATVVRHYAEVQRAVADRIGLGGWCDALAWADLFPDPQHALDRVRGSRR